MREGNQDERGHSLAELRRLCEAATPGPWTWKHHEFNERIRKRSRAGKRSREQFVFLLTGPMISDIAPEYADEFDYHIVLDLRWYQVKGGSLIVSGWKPNDMEFIAAARTALPALLDEVERLRQECDEARAGAHQLKLQRDVARRFIRRFFQHRSVAVVTSEMIEAVLADDPQTASLALPWFPPNERSGQE